MIMISWGERERECEIELGGDLTRQREITFLISIQNTRLELCYLIETIETVEGGKNVGLEKF